MSWIARVLPWLQPVPAAPAPAAASPLSAELAEGLQRAARAQARHGLRLDEIEQKLEAGLADLRGALGRVAAGVGAADDGRCDDVFDAMDLIDEAVRLVDRAGSAGVAEGLLQVNERLARFLTQRALTRVGRPGAAPDGRVLRVVGVVAAPDVPAGAIARVVRAGIVRGDQVVREGEVLVSRPAATDALR